MMISRQLLLTYLYLLIYICLSSGVILFNKVRLLSLRLLGFGWHWGNPFLCPLCSGAEQVMSR
jgi:hypothetical protein